MAAKAKKLESLELTGDVPERSDVVFPDGSKCQMRAVGEMPIGSIKRLRSLQNAEDGLEGIYDALRAILVDPTEEQIDSLTVSHVERIIAFFSQAAGAAEQTNTSKRSRKSKGSTGAGRKTG